MPRFTVEKIRKMMEQRENIRNISVIAHVDHGKSTLTDSLIYKAGILPKQQTGNVRFTDNNKQEIERGITIKSASVSLYYEKLNSINQITTPYLINLIDSPGHVDFSSEVTAALRVTDGALVVVDCIEGVCVQTTTVLKQAISERIRPILFLNKLDRSFLEKQSDLEDCYLSFRKAIESVNVVTQTYKDNALGEIELYPQNGNVGFGSGLHAWGFTLKDFAKMYHVKFKNTGLKKSELMEKLWGDHFWDPNKSKWVKQNTTGKLQRGFCEFVLKPIKVLCDSIMSSQKDIYLPIIRGLQLNISNQEMSQCAKPKDLLKLVMQTWLPCGDALLDMIVDHLPSPTIAQKYRVEKLYTGPLDSPEALSIRNCDPKGPLGMYICKLIPGDAGRFVAFGRVFSGTVKAGQKVRIMGNEYTITNRKDLSIDRIQNTLLIMGADTKPLFDCPAGNVVGLTGIDKYISKSATISDSETFFPLKTMKFSVAPVVQMAVAPKKASDLPKLTEGLRKLSKSDQTIKIWQSKSGENIVAGAGELHLQVCLTNLQEDFMKNCPIVVSEPIVSYAETIVAKSGDYQNYPSICVAKSPNKLNRLYCQAMPLSDKFIKDIESGNLKRTMDPKVFARNLSDNYGWNNDEARKIWTFGRTKDTLPNVIVESTKGVQYLNEVKDNICESFHEFTECGVLCGETIRGIRIDIKDMLIHSDSSHRGTAQIIPACKKAFKACQIASHAMMLEPMFLVEISVASSFVEKVTRVIRSRRGKITMIEPQISMPLTNMKAFLPVKESFGVTQELRQQTSGNAFPQMIFSHWDLLPGDPFDTNSLAYKVVIDVRKRKGDKLQLPNFNQFYDKIN